MDWPTSPSRHPPTISMCTSEGPGGSPPHTPQTLAPGAGPRSVGSIYVETGEATLTVTIASDGDVRDVELTAQLGCDWRVAPCGTRLSDWSPDGSEDRWLATRRVDRGAEWLQAHP